uniref:GH18 domain-containing protein n=1 Tax=Parastrongyloides trichosuri TaxID=131310 RepID=A0A0N4YZZ5_PARTI
MITISNLFKLFFLYYTLTIGFSQTTNSRRCEKRIVGYYTSWLDRYITASQARSLTHVIYSFIHLTNNGTLYLGDLNKTNSEKFALKKLEHLFSMRKVNPNLNIMFAVGGWENSQHFSYICSDPRRRINFILEIVKYIDKYDFDGVDIDWEYPTTGGAVEGMPEDKHNYVLLMKEMREAFTHYENKVGRYKKLIISFAGAAGEWTLRPGFDLNHLLEYVDFANIMSYDYFGAWDSKWGAFTGPPAPLYHGSLKSMSGKMNVDWTVKYYYCHSRNLNKLNMGIPLYGRYWNNVEGPIDKSDDMWRTARKNRKGKYEGGHITWRSLKYKLNCSWEIGRSKYHEKSKSPYIIENDKFLAFENPKSIYEKMKYAQKKDLGGVMMWAIEYDDDNNTLLDTINSINLCDSSLPKEQYKCSPLKEKRWWTADEEEQYAGMCGKSAPLYKGYYPICDPEDIAFSCCGRFGYCGTGPEYCDCPECIDYGKNPELTIQEPIKPSTEVRWYTNDAEEGKRGRCGRNAPLMENGEYAICNPDDNAAFCCSSAGYCGSTHEHCECDGCIDFKKRPDYKYSQILWWTYGTSPANSGKCGKSAPQLPNGRVPICNPESENAHCCSLNGWCGTGDEYCLCNGCVDFRKNPEFRYD